MTWTNGSIRTEDMSGVLLLHSKKLLAAQQNQHLPLSLPQSPSKTTSGDNYGTRE